MANKWIQKEIEISTRYSKDERTAIGIDIVRYVRERTLSGKGPGDKAWSGKAGEYSKAYTDSLDFKIGRKNKGKVNLKLSGDMLEELTLLNEKSGKVKIGFDDSATSAGKAEGNIRGTYGNASPIAGKARPFLDLTSKEIASILSKYPLKDKEARQERTDTVLASKEGKPFVVDEGDDGE